MHNFFRCCSTAVFAFALMLAAPAKAQHSGQLGQANAGSVAAVPPATSASVPTSSASSDATLELFKSLSPEDRSLVVDQAMAAFNSMSPQEREALVQQAKAQLGSGGGATMSSEWEKLLTPEQKKAFSAQIEPHVQGASATPAANAATAAQPSVSSLLMQINNLPPEQQKSLLNALNARAATPAQTPAATPADPCAQYKTINPSFYASCVKRMAQ
jgi:hypothetical protein